MKISQMVQPTTENIAEAKKAYNRVLKRYKEASQYLDNQEIPQSEREKHIIPFRVEIVDVLEAYITVLKDWGVQINDDEIMGGMKIE